MVSVGETGWHFLGRRKTILCTPRLASSPMSEIALAPMPESRIVAAIATRNTARPRLEVDPPALSPSPSRSGSRWRT
jgi:hypothetical protein